MDKNMENMLAGKPYIPSQAQGKISHKAHRLCQEYNAIPDTDKIARDTIIDKLLGKHGKNTYLQGPIQIDYGKFTEVGDNFYSNFNLTILDTCPVKIGNNVMLGPNITLATPLHPLLAEQRNDRVLANGEIGHYEYGASITIGNNCWLASNVTVCAGVTIGNNCVIGAGAVVTHDIPDNSLAVGVPAKVIRKLSEKDRIKDWPY
ncbi:sugar O-acetyltransferase [Lactobacillus sp. LL6]|uniref:sugar O-acetyltransferase n=1 Tax=Lactobacillus sp. LL6 TaxID=2596827 RepID=UPI001186778F|nr:sugar O-acetyltransferase [Lactobacillus sp. LL6]TSO25265.1 sugar O-acetyltransferase [Lactobacillus sp. LL6]